MASSLACPRCGGPIDPAVGRCPKDGATLSKAAIAIITTLEETSTANSRGEVMPEPADPGVLVGKQLGRYVLEEMIGRGGMGIVFKARHVDLGHRVAIKVLDRRLTSPEGEARFFQEAKAAAQIGHVNIVQIVDFDRHPERGSYLVMELLDGISLADLIHKQGALEEQRVVAIGLQICSALAAAHKLGIIHRDLKPANVFLTNIVRREVVKVMDFGVAKIAQATGDFSTQPGAIIGTPQYMSPEQWVGDEIDARVDIYSLGVMLYEMATGKPPFHKAKKGALVRHHVMIQAESPRAQRRELSKELDHAILKCLRKEPGERYQTMEKLADALAEVPVDSTASGGMSRTQRRRGRVIATVAAVAAAASAAVITLHFTGREPKAPTVVAPATSPIARPDGGVVNVTPPPVDKVVAPVEKPQPQVVEKAAPPSKKKPVGKKPADKKLNLLYGD
jgi:serine/threonine-protein kinase